MDDDETAIAQRSITRFVVSLDKAFPGQFQPEPCRRALEPPDDCESGASTEFHLNMESDIVLPQSADT